MATNQPIKRKNNTVRPNTSGGLIDVLIRKFFYRDGLRVAIKAILGQIIIIILLVIALIISIKHANSIEPKYFAVDATGRIIPIVALNDPYLTNERLLSWASEAAQKVYNYDFKKYKQQLNESRSNFTTEGWNSFVTALEASQVLEKVKRDRDIVSATPLSSPIIAAEDTVGGIKIWKIRAPLIVTYQGQGTIATKNIMVTMLITRVSLLDNSNGVAITSFISTDINQ